MNRTAITPKNLPQYIAICETEGQVESLRSFYAHPITEDVEEAFQKGIEAIQILRPTGITKRRLFTLYRSAKRKINQKGLTFSEACDWLRSQGVPEAFLGE